VQTIRLLLKLPLFVIIICIFCVVSLFNNLYYYDHYKKLRNANRISSFFCRLLLVTLSVKLKMNHDGACLSKSNYLIVSNHLSYLDIFMISSMLPSVFVASVDGVRNSRLLGPIAEIGGGIFVDRLNARSLPNEIKHM